MKSYTYSQNYDFYLFLIACICFCHKLTVLAINIETVKGPTPPGTGVLKEHTFLAYYDISPLSFP